MVGKERGLGLPFMALSTLGSFAGVKPGGSGWVSMMPAMLLFARPFPTLWMSASRI